MRLLAALQAHLTVDRVKVLPRKDLEARDDPLPREVLRGPVAAALRHLHLERALAEPELEHLGDVLRHVRLEHDVVARDPEVDIALADERRDVGRRQKYAVKGCEDGCGRRELFTYRAML